jgi:hypothetical protein
VRREDCLRQLIDWLQPSVMTWSDWRHGARALVGDPRRGHPLQVRDRPCRRTGQQHVFCLDVDTGRHSAVPPLHLHLQVVRDSRHQFIGAASAATSSSTVVEPGSA